MDPSGNADPRHGIREFIVGTGGESLDTVLPATPNLQAWADQYYGVMKLALHPHGYTLGLRVGAGEPDRAGRHAADLQRRGQRQLPQRERPVS